MTSTLADTLRVHLHRGYTLSGSSVATNVLLYAADVCLVADGTASCQHLLSLVESWLHWSGMLAKIPKCFSFAIQASTAKRFDPGLFLHGKKILFIGNKSVKFLGGPLSVPTNQREHQQNLETKLMTLMHVCQTQEGFILFQREGEGERGRGRGRGRGRERERKSTEVRGLDLPPPWVRGPVL